ncbi:PIN domain-containing protein [Aetokthonos hydrillicola]|uniref:PIN domain-containing protein n=1 Tax=Aetokthonos hydrillicola TaxID=1550245 RepID=UPI0028BE3B05|nr:PIN domain-containing protein [Aetokthonos hydrillicola]
MKQLEQFSEGQTKVILSEIVKNELLVHLEKKAENTHAEIDKALRNAKNYWLLEDNTIDSIKFSIFQDKKPTLIAAERLEKFIEITSLEIVDAQNHIAVSQLLEKYFQAKPPFAETGEKKNEFPDAIALMSLEVWAKKNTTKVLVISKDKGWEQYCNDCENLIFFNDLSNAFELFQLQIKPYDICKRLSQKYASGQLGFVTNEINSALNNGIYNFNIYVEAESAYQYEDEITDINYEKFEFKIIKEPNIIFRPIKFETDTLVVEVDLLSAV